MRSLIPIGLLTYTKRIQKNVGYTRGKSLGQDSISYVEQGVTVVMELRKLKGIESGNPKPVDKQKEKPIGI